MAAALPLLQADWPAPAGVHALTTRRHGAGISPAPFAQFNLGNRHAADGDTPANVEHNRQLLQQGLALPSAPHWLRRCTAAPCCASMHRRCPARASRWPTRR